MSVTAGIVLIGEYTIAAVVIAIVMMAFGLCGSKRAIATQISNGTKANHAISLSFPVHQDGQR